MTRSDLVNLLAEHFPQLTHRDAELAVKAILDSMSDALARGHRIEIRGFGVFEPRPRKKGMGRNIKTGDAVKIPNGKSIRFKPGKDLREIEVK